MFAIDTNPQFLKLIRSRAKAIMSALKSDRKVAVLKHKRREFFSLHRRFGQHVLQEIKVEKRESEANNQVSVFGKGRWAIQDLNL